MAALLEVLQGVLGDVPSAGDVGTAEASPKRLGCAAVHTEPFLGVEDGMTAGELQVLDVPALVHR